MRSWAPHPLHPPEIYKKFVVQIAREPFTLSLMPYAYYNEIDPYAVQWLKNLIQKQLIIPGEVDERPIQDVCPKDLAPFTRCHFFAGIAGWDLALRLANFPADRKVWTGSCPCQPFSTAGARLGFADERHLWPFWFHLISVCRPSTVFGEQVANGSGPWLDLVLADLEGADYAVGAAVLPAAGVGAPHIRDRVWFVAQSKGERWGETRADSERPEKRFTGAGSFSDSLGSQLWDQPGWSGRTNGSGASFAREPGEGIPDPDEQPVGWSAESRRQRGHWGVEPDVGRVVDGFPTRAQRLRAYGNAIVPQVASTFIKAYLECRP